MTAVVAWYEEKNKTVYMGADSLGSDGFTGITRKDEKIFEVEKFLIGGTSSFRMLQLLKYKLKPSKHPKDMDPYDYMVTYFVEDVRKLFKDHGYSSVNNNTEKGGEFIVGYKGRIFVIQSDFQVAEPQDNFAAVGAGEYHCLAVLECEKYRVDFTPESRLLKALHIAEKYCVGVGGPFVIKKLL